MSAAEYIKVCKRSDPNVNKCINASINALRPKLLKGIPELDVPGVDPLYLKEIRLSRGPQGARLDATITNIKVFGANSFIVQELKTDLDKNIFDFDLLLPRLHFVGNYKIAMRILLLNIHGNGGLTGNFTNYACKVKMTGHKILRGKDEFLELDRMKLKLKVGDAEIALSNLFDGDPVLGPMANRLINDNSRVFLDEILPTLESSLADLFTDIGNKITLKFTYKELFP
ncbi:hypothetical protein ONE63_007037 [Megalurothrips usitatus]|uniref:Circadian clock-controlled protein-like n=1 Tax=Megalurothrips usitatus TaxID=439358 RepID=A0AAV7XRK1_9NEOP|nr:hypothetical protein ONE63_007037 [Megalurothrips usitatus]